MVSSGNDITRNREFWGYVLNEAWFSDAITNSRHIGTSKRNLIWQVMKLNTVESITSTNLAVFIFLWNRLSWRVTLDWCLSCTEHSSRSSRRARGRLRCSPCPYQNSAELGFRPWRKLAWLGVLPNLLLMVGERPEGLRRSQCCD
jgi:hypothetical protein